MAEEKARAGMAQLDEALRDDVAVLGADTSVVVAGRILGKPLDAAHAREMLTELSGCEHQVLSAVSLVWGASQETCLSVSTVTFAELSPHLVERYVATGEPMDKAGAYGIQGRGAFLIEQISGSYSGIVGLPLRETLALLEQAGVSCWATGN
jgi:septum formation protein